MKENDDIKKTKKIKNKTSDLGRVNRVDLFGGIVDGDITVATARPPCEITIYGHLCTVVTIWQKTRIYSSVGNSVMADRVARSVVLLNIECWPQRGR
jgi:hypothetical protein